MSAAERQTETRTRGGRRVAVGQHWNDDGYVMRVVAVSDSHAWVRHVNAKAPQSMQTVLAWFDEWTMTRDA